MFFYLAQEEAFLHFERLPGTVLLHTILPETTLKVNHYDDKFELQKQI